MFEIIPIIGHAVMITIFVFTMMLLVDYINVTTKGKKQKMVLCAFYSLRNLVP